MPWQAASPELRLLHLVMCAGYRTALVQLCGRHTSSSLGLSPLVQQLQSALDAEGAPAGALGFALNALGWFLLPLGAAAPASRPAIPYRHGR